MCTSRTILTSLSDSEAVSSIGLHVTEAIQYSCFMQGSQLVGVGVNLAKAMFPQWRRLCSTCLSQDGRRRTSRCGKGMSTLAPLRPDDFKGSHLSMQVCERQEGRGLNRPLWPWLSVLTLRPPSQHRPQPLTHLLGISILRNYLSGGD